MRLARPALLIAIALAFFVEDWTWAAQKPVQVGGPLTYQVIAARPRLNRKVTGPVTRYVQGVPAEPVDSFVWDGDGSVAIEGDLIMGIDPIADEGFIQATWTDEHGDWTYFQSVFIHPEHSSGVRIGTSVEEIHSFLNEGITHNVYLHGDTTAGMPVLPTIFNHVATWGPAQVLLNDEPFLNPFELPAPAWLGHAMVTEGVRRPDGTVRTIDGSIYNPGMGSVGVVEEGGDLEVHLVFHDERFPRTANVPPIFSFFYHLVFEDVWIQIVEADEPLTIGTADVCPVDNESPPSLDQVRPRLPLRSRGR